MANTFIYGNFAYENLLNFYSEKSLSKTLAHLNYLENLCFKEKIFAISIIKYEAYEATKNKDLGEIAYFFTFANRKRVDKLVLENIEKESFYPRFIAPNTEYYGQFRDDAFIPYSKYKTKIRQIQNLIKKGAVYQINFTAPIIFSSKASISAIFANIIERQDTKYRALIDFENQNTNIKIASFSPELFFKKVKNKIITKPMKGTLKIDKSAKNMELKTLSAKLKNDDKNKAENMMIVDLLRNDLSKISDDVRIKNALKIEKYQTLLQMTTSIIADTSSPLGEVFGALFPCGSITGAPKKAALKYIKTLENEKRGFYCGAIGVIDNEGAEFSVPIRTIENIGQNLYKYAVGSGITINSKVKDEFKECLLKAKILNQEKLILSSAIYFNPHILGHFKNIYRAMNKSSLKNLIIFIAKIKQKSPKLSLIKEVIGALNLILQDSPYPLLDLHLKRFNDNLKALNLPIIKKESLEDALDDFAHTTSGDLALKIRLKDEKVSLLAHKIDPLKSLVVLENQKPSDLATIKNTRRQIYKINKKNCEKVFVNKDKLIEGNRAGILELRGNLVVFSDDLGQIESTSKMLLKSLFDALKIAHIEDEIKRNSKELYLHNAINLMQKIKIIKAKNSPSRLQLKNKKEEIINDKNSKITLFQNKFLPPILPRQIITIIDCHCSFTQNIILFAKRLNCEVLVVPLDELDKFCKGGKFDFEKIIKGKLIIGPGPDSPKNSLLELVRNYHKPILGICLGHQAIAMAYGEKLLKFPPKHGINEKIKLTKLGRKAEIFAGISGTTKIARYHSLGISKDTKNKVLEVLAFSSEGCLQALKVRGREVYGVQFHLESILSKDGMMILRNFLKIKDQ